MREKAFLHMHKYLQAQAHAHARTQARTPSHPIVLFFSPTGQQSPTSQVLFPGTGHTKVNGGFDLGTKAGVPGRTGGPHAALPQQATQALTKP